MSDALVERLAEVVLLLVVEQEIAAARAEERERIAQAIEAAGRRRPSQRDWMWATDAAVAARIARTATSTEEGR